MVLSIVIHRVFEFPAELLILLFLMITFLQSGYDKIKDWNGNLGFLKEHFKGTAFGKSVPLLLGFLLIFEIVSGIMLLLGAYTILAYGVKYFALWSVMLSALTFLFLLLGQRIAKDYAGAMTIAVYFIINVIGVFLLQ